MLLGVSRKSFIGKLLGAEVDARLPASLACASLAVTDGVQIIRTHDVTETIQAVRMAEAIFGPGKKIMWFYLQNGWRPALEILILAVIIYYTSRFLRGTRGWPVVIGFVIVLLALALATTILKLQVLRWLLGTFSAFFAVAVIIIFQPELRRLLAELGNLPFFASTREKRESIEVVIQTCERLAEVKIGALIAIEQSIQLHEAVESGVPVDCDATPEMLETIFFPNNAIHDGGVILKGDRIAYAACIFPLTQRQGLNKSLGTRHRAAIGFKRGNRRSCCRGFRRTGSVSHAYKASSCAA